MDRCSMRFQRWGRHLDVPDPPVGSGAASHHIGAHHQYSRGGGLARRLLRAWVTSSSAGRWIQFDWFGCQQFLGLPG
eukprot:12895161-Prorocentrum_lima.AAC.1